MSTVISKYLPTITGMSTVLSSLPLQKVPTTVVAKIPPAEVTPAVTAPVTTASTPPTTVISKYLPKISTISTVARSLTIMSKETEKETEQLIEQAYEQVKRVVVPKVPAPTVPTVPTVPDWTHKLVLRFIRLPWASQSNVSGAISGILLPIINPFVFGFDCVRHELDWQANTVTIYYRTRGTPAINVVALLLAIAAVAIGVGILFFGLGWYEQQTAVAEHTKTVDELFKEGKITPEQYAQFVQQPTPTPTPTGVTDIIPLVILGGIAIAVLGIVPRRRD